MDCRAAAAGARAGSWEVFVMTMQAAALILRQGQRQRQVGLTRTYAQDPYPWAQNPYKHN